jgi:hypothetical protein
MCVCSRKKIVGIQYDPLKFYFWAAAALFPKKVLLEKYFIKIENGHFKMSKNG